MTDQIIDNSWDGLGTTGYNMNVDYQGLRVLMSPKVFLSLAAPTNFLGSIEYIENYLRSGGKIGSPFLLIHMPDQWEHDDFSTKAKIVGHEGRNRMSAVLKVYGNVLIETHLFIIGYRRRHITKNIINQLNNSIISEKSNKLVYGPFFDIKD